MPLRLGRRTAGLGAVVAMLVLLVTVLLLTRSSPPRLAASTAVSAATAVPRGSATDARHIPWFGLRLLLDPVTFTDEATTSVKPNITATAGILVDIDTNRIL
ncbi:MAG: hypothetical protein JOY80_07195, partial [Candidatus Dormibacteraeota bacterium]|nr:hypothetical protein [Candidatus Dormibacteraeota bacterium]